MIRPIRPVHHTAIVLALLAFTAACHSAAPATEVVDAAHPDTTPSPAAVTVEEKEAAPLQYAQIRQMEALGNRCHWLGPAEQAAVAASHAERHAWLVWQGLDIASAEAQAEKLVQQSGSIDCNSAESEQHWLGLGYGAWQMRSSWALRGQAMLPGADRPGWFAGKSSVVEHQAALDDAVAGLKAIDTASVELSQTMFRQMAEQMLAVRCEAAESGCPTTAPDDGFRTYAELVLKQAEAYAQVLSQTDDKTGQPPEPKAQ